MTRTLFIPLLIAVSLVCTFHSPSKCQGFEDKDASFKSIARTTADDFLYLSTSPYRLVREQPEDLLVFTGATIGLVLIGDQLFDQIYGVEKHRLLPRNLTLAPGRFYDQIGPANVVYGLVGTGFAGGVIFRDQKMLETSRLMLESVLFTRTISVIGKTILGRERPYSSSHPTSFELLEGYESHSLRSMPSLHTSSIFATVTVIAKQYPYTPVKIGAYGLATSVALQRIASRKHWLADVFMGGALGYFVGSALVERTYGNDKKRDHLKPLIGGNRLGFTYSF